jgi:hypothetical protein
LAPPYAAALALGGVAVTHGGLAELATGPRAPSPGAVLVMQAAELTEGRVWADATLTAEASLYSRGELRLAGSYSGREWSIVHGPLQAFLGGFGSARERTTYLVAAGVGAVVLPAGMRPSILDLATDEPARWIVAGGDRGWELLLPPWTAPLAWQFPRDEHAALTAPDLPFRDVADSYVRDRAVEHYARAALRSPDAAVVTYRGGGLTVRTTVTAEDRLLLVNENWDRAVRATVDGAPAAVERVGPNLTGVDMTGHSGDVIIVLTHARPRTYGVGLALSVLALVAGIALSLLPRRWHRVMMRSGAGAGRSVRDEAGDPLLDGDP